MKSQLFRVAATAVLLMVAGVLFVSAQDQSVPNKGSQLTASEVKALSRNAKTAQDHLELAAYFRNEAREATKMADLHEDMMNAYQSAPAAGTTTELQMHCQEIAESARRAAKSANAMAMQQEALAAQAQGDTTATK